MRLRYLSSTRPIIAAACLAILAATGGPASAQPGQTPPPQPAPQPAPTYNPDYGQPAPYYHLLTWEERDLLARGEISEGAHFGGGLLGTFMGLGFGHAVQGRYLEKGWIFTVGEVGSFTALITGVIRCFEGDDDPEFGDDGCDNNDEMLVWGGIIGILVFRTWEMIDVWAGPASHNARVRAARNKAYGYTSHPGYSLYLVPSSKGSGAVGGFTLRF